jgi:hypothetical protein
MVIEFSHVVLEFDRGQLRLPNRLNSQLPENAKRSLARLTFPFKCSNRLIKVCDDLNVFESISYHPLKFEFDLFRVLHEHPLYLKYL